MKPSELTAQVEEKRQSLNMAQAAAWMKGNNWYGGTVDPVEIAKRRAKNKRQKASRRANRRKK